MKLFAFTVVLMLSSSCAFGEQLLATGLEINFRCPVIEPRNVTRKGEAFLWPDASRYSLKDSSEGIRFS